MGRDEEETHLGGGVNLSLPGVLSLSEHGSSHELVSVLGRDEVGSLEEDGRSVVPGHRLPLLVGGKGRLNRLLDELGRGEVVGAEGTLGVGVGLELLGGVAGLDLWGLQTGQRVFLADERVKFFGWRERWEGRGEVERTSFPSMTQGTSKGIWLFISAIADSSFFRSADPGA